MKVKAAVLALMTAATVTGAVPLPAMEAVIDNHGSPPQKDECLLSARNCGTESFTIQQRIDRLQHEIQKGNGVYTPEELNMLRRKLRDQYRIPDINATEKQEAS